MKSVVAGRWVACVVCLVWAAACSGSEARASSSVSKGRAAERVEGARPLGDVVVVLDEDFLNALLDAILDQPAPPRFPLSKGGSKSDGKNSCASELILARESGGKRTAVSFVGGQVGAIVAFRGAYEAPLVGCVSFEGWADTRFNLSFDAARQAFTSRVEVRDVSLRNIPSMMSGGITGLVQDAIDKRVNPIEILRAEQLAARLPLAQGSALRLRAKEVRHEVAGKELRLRIVYEIISGQ